MTAYISITRPFSEFSDLPTEIILLIYDSCADDDLLTLCQTSRHLHNLALPILLAHHGLSQSDILSGIITISTLSLPFFQRTLFASPINKLSCIFDEATAERDVLGLRRLVSRLPQIGEVEVTVYGAFRFPVYREIGLRCREVLLNLLPALISERSVNLLALSWGSFFISRPHRVIRALPPSPTIKDVGLCVFCAAQHFQRIRKLWAHMSSVVLDPRGRMFQDQRICDDVRPIFRPLNTLHVKFPISPLPELAEWALLTSNDNISKMYMLVIKRVSDLEGYWHPILSSFHLPSLRQLIISDSVRLSCSDFAAFAQRHPTIDQLTLGYNSIENSSLSTLPTGFLPGLARLIGPSSLVNHISRSGESFPSMNLVAIDRPSTHNRPWPRGYWQNLNNNTPTVQPHFSFDTLNAVLEAITQLSSARHIKLILTLPGRSESNQWLNSPRREQSQRVEHRLHAVTSLTIQTGQRKSLSNDTLPLLERWISLFPSLGHVTFRVQTLPRMNAQRHVEPSDRPLREELLKTFPLIDGVVTSLEHVHACYVLTYSMKYE